MLNLPTLETTQCVVPVHPRGDIEGTVGTLTEQGPVLCGDTYPYTDECHLLSKTDGSWIKMNSSMEEKRIGAAGVVLDNGEWWVTGNIVHFRRLKIVV